MRERVIIITFTDPMMGLSWECEPLFRKLKTHFAGRIEVRTVMSLLVRDVRDFMTPSELALEPAECIRRYNARLAKIYESEEAISGMPINMNGFRLFDEAHRTFLPLNLAYYAARLSDAGKADLFLYNLRFTTVVDCRPTTHLEEILAVVRKTGMDADAFLRYFNDGSAETALEQDLQFWHNIGIHSLPAYLIQYGEKAVLIQSFDYKDFISVIDELSSGSVRPQAVRVSSDALRELLRTHPLISPVEVREAFDLTDDDAVMRLLKPMLESGEVSIREVKRGSFVEYYC